MKASSLTNNESSFIAKLEKEVENNLTNEQFGVEELAASVSMSRSHLHRKIKKATRQSVSQFIREYRLQKAHELLANEDLTAVEVAYRVGFGSASYFSKAFHDFYGYTPLEAKNHKPPIKKPVEKQPGTIFTLLLLMLIVALVVSGLFFYFDREDIEPSATGSIAVLPFKNLSADDENQYFADGVMDAILQKLSHIDKLKVISRTSVEKYRNTQMSIPEIARQLQVLYILEGSAQKYGDDIRIITQLINATNDQHAWSNNYTSKFENVLQLQSAIAEKVALALEAQLTSREKNMLKEQPTDNIDAYNFYLMAEFQLNKMSQESLQNAIPLYKKAIALDSVFADAYVGLGTVYEIGGAVWGFYDQNLARDSSEFFLKKALMINANLADAHNVLAGVYFYYHYDFSKAAYHFSRVKEIKGQEGDFSSDFYIKMRMYERAIKNLNLSLREDPAQSVAYAFLAEAEYASGNKQKAVKIMDNAFALYEDYFFLREAAKLYLLYGEIGKSKKAFTKLQNNFSDRPPIHFWLAACHAYYEQSDPQKHIDRLHQMYDENASGSPAWFLAMYYAVANQPDLMFEWLERSYNKKEVEMTWLKSEPLLNPYQQDPRYKDVLKRMNFPKQLSW